MNVDFLGGADILVTEQHGDFLKRYAVVIQNTGDGMAESVNGAMGKTCLVGQAIDNTVDRTEIAVGRAVNRADDVVVPGRTVAYHTLAFFLLGFFLFQGVQNFVGKRNLTVATFRLRLCNELRDAGTSTCAALVDAEQPFLEVHIVPRQSEQFPASCAREKHQNKENIDVALYFLSIVKQLSDLLRGVGRDFGLDVLLEGGKSAVSDRVAVNQFVDAGVFQRDRENAANVLDALGTQSSAVIAAFCFEILEVLTKDLWSEFLQVDVLWRKVGNELAVNGLVVSLPCRWLENVLHVIQPLFQIIREQRIVVFLFQLSIVGENLVTLSYCLFLVALFCFDTSRNPFGFPFIGKNHIVLTVFYL